MAIPKEPRQMMINMMYLVLTAMLALNVSAEILNAFKIVNTGIASSTAALESKSSDEMRQFAKLATDDPKNAADKYKRALAAREFADSMYAEIEEIKRNLMIESGITVDESGDTVLQNDRDTHTPTLFMVNKKKGYELQQMINSAGERFVSFYPENAQESARSTISLQADDASVPNKGAQKRDWVQYNFMEVPSIAAVTILTKLQNDVRNAESDVIKYLIKSVTADILDLDQLKGRAIAKKSFLVTGDTYEADLFVTASSSQSTPKAYLGNFDPNLIKRTPDGRLPDEVAADKVPLLAGYTELPPAENGIVKLKRAAGGEGITSYRGVIEVINPKTGEKNYYPFENEYQVARPFAVVSPDKMNVLYIGVDNPISISVPGFPADKIVASITQGSLAGGNGKYTAKVTNSSAPANISVAVKTEDGTKSMGVSEFRVKRIPDPKVMVGNAEGPVIPAGTLKAMPGITAIADNFPFDVNFQVRGFEVLYKKGNSAQLFSEINQGALFNGNVKNMLSQASPGDRVWFDNIKVNAPDGTTRTLSLSFKVM